MNQRNASIRYRIQSEGDCLFPRQNVELMPTYFKPLRRKVGVATLVMACVFAAGWVRSMFYYDDLFCDTDPRHRECLISHRNNLCWMRLRQFEDTPWLVP